MDVEKTIQSSYARFVGVLVLTLLLELGPFVRTADSITITVHSGNGSVGQPDAIITYVQAPSWDYFSHAFRSHDFSMARTGQNAVVVAPHSTWMATLPCDSSAQWIAVDASRSDRSALYAVPFTIPQGCCGSTATLDLCWAVDNRLGDGVGPRMFNPTGVYVNGKGVGGKGGSAGHQSQLTADISSRIHCGTNYLYLYVRDTGKPAAGVIFHADITIDCVVPTRETTWGAIKALYRD